MRGVGSKRFPKQVPRKSRQEIPPRCLRAEKCKGEGHEPRVAPLPHRCRERGRGGVKERKPCRKGCDRKRHQSGVAVGVHIESVADPINAGEEVTKAECPANGGRAHQPLAEGYRRFLCFTLTKANAVERPDQDREGGEQDGPQEKGRHRKHGKCARHKSDDAPTSKS